MRRTPAAALLALVAFFNLFVNGRGSASSSQKSAENQTNSFHELKVVKSSSARAAGKCDASLQEVFDELFGPGVVVAGSKEFAGQAREHKVRFLIATVPDPRHTHLALLFDRMLEGAQQAAVEERYTFQSTKSLPWPVEEEAKGGDGNGGSGKTAKSAASAKPQAGSDDEVCPGALVFRRHSTDSGHESEHEEYLVILLVGERPTTGLNPQQFVNALAFVKSSAPKENVIGILGPTFSGSYSSIDRFLSQSGGQAPCPKPPPSSSPSGSPEYFYVIRSSSTMSGQEINWFRTRNGCHASVMSFFDTSQYQERMFLNFLTCQGYGETDVAVLSEDETAYGRLDEREADQPVQVYFPRGIASLRAAYQAEASLATGDGAKSAPRTTLKPDLGTSGKDDDSVPTFDRKHLALSQEAVLEEIIRTLKTHQSKYVMIRATDEMDLLFLAGQVRRSYPQGRVVAIGADLLARRDVDDETLKGMMSLSPYPPFPGWVDETEKGPEVHRVFADGVQEGEYNAALDLLEETGKPGQVDRSSDAGPAALPEARYAGLMAPKLSGVQVAVKDLRRPWLWLSVVGHDGFWPVTAMPFQSLGEKCTSQQGAVKEKEAEVRSGPSPANVASGSGGVRPVEREFGFGKSRVVNEMLVLLLIVVSMVLVGYSWLGDLSKPGPGNQCLGPLKDGERARLLVFGTAVLLVSWFLALMSWWALLPAALLAASMIANVYAFNRGLTWETAGWLTLATGLTVAAWFVFAPREAITRFIFLYRGDRFTTGVSPNLPLVLMCGGVLWWLWYVVCSRSSFDRRRPLLPRGDKLVLPSQDRFGKAGSCRVLLITWPFGVLALSGFVALALQQLRLESLEGRRMDLLYNGALFFGLMLLLHSIYGAWVYWLRCRDLLTALNRTPLRHTFRAISGFEWRRVWGLAGGNVNFAYQPMVRALESLGRLRGTLNPSQHDYLDSALAELDVQMQAFAEELDPASTALAKAGSQTAEPSALSTKPGISAPLGQASPSLVSMQGVCEREEFNLLLSRQVEAFQEQLAIIATLVYRCVLEDFWNKRDLRFVTRDPKKGDAGDGKAALGAEEIPPSVQWAEEFVALVYISFIIRVLIRIRWLGVAAIGLYVFLLLSVTVYPFEPDGSIHAFFVFVFLAMLGSFAMIYADMHRDVTLSHLTDTQPGQLGGDYWWRMASFAGVPLLTLVSTQVPQLSRSLFFWVKPLLDGIGKG